MRGILEHAWLRSSAVTLLAPFYLIEDLAPKTRSGSDLEVFSLTAWTANPDGIPRASELLLRPHDAVAFDADPVRVFQFARPLIRFPVSIHVSETENFRFSTSPPPPPPRPGVDGDDAAPDLPPPLPAQCYDHECLLSSLLLKELQDGETLESAPFELDDDECLVIVHIHMAMPYPSHGDLDIDPRMDISQMGGDDAEHPTYITMGRAPLPSDTCDIYFKHTKVNLLLYTCQLVPFEDGILLDPSLVFMHRCEWSYTITKEESKLKSMPTPSAREVWKQRRNKTEL